MKRLFFILILGIVLTINALAGDAEWFALFYRDGGFLKVKAFPLEKLDSLLYLKVEDAEDPDSEFPTHIRLSDNEGERMELSLDSVQSIQIRNNIARIYIDTDPLMDEIPDKQNYVKASFLYVPASGEADSLELEVNIRGRGNTTWEMPKKPYRLKFDKKQSIAGMTKAKNYALIANYLDNTLMRNAVAFEVARLVDMPYVNTSVPVDLFFNGVPRGSYMLTEKIGINSASADFDEYTGMLWEIDSYYDEEYRFRSTRFNLPCMAKDPDFLEIAEDDPVTAQALWTYWKADLDLALAKVYDGKWTEVFDERQLAKYVLVNHLCGNFEITQAKSIYLYKKAPGEKYCFGPVWDFDWALGFTDHAYPVGCQFAIQKTAAYDFWYKIFTDSHFQEIFREELDAFIHDGLSELMDFIDEYAYGIRISAYEDSELWPEEKFYGFEKHEICTSRFDENVEWIKGYINERLERILSHSRLLLY